MWGSTSSATSLAGTPARPYAPPPRGRRSDGQLGGQPEARERLRAQERGDLLDLRASEREDRNSVRHEPPLLLIPEVLTECRCPVGAHPDQPPGPVATTQRPLGQERRDRLAAAEPAGDRRHRDAGVLGQQRDDGLDVAPLPRIDVSAHELAEALVAERS